MPEPQSSQSLHRKIAEIVAAVEYVAKDKDGPQNQYRYVSDAAMLQAVRGHMAERRLTLVPRVVPGSVSVVPRSGKPGDVTTLVVEYVLTDGDSGESIVCATVGQGFDSLDKGAYKAMTGALKYVLRQTFLIPTGDDAEAPTTVDDEEPTAGQRKLVKQMKESLDLAGEQWELLCTAHGVQAGVSSTRTQIDGLIAALFDLTTEAKA